MSIPYYILGIIYLIALLGCLVFFLFNLYHLRRFGYFDFTGFMVTMLCGSVTVMVIVFSVIFLGRIDWLDSGSIVQNPPIDNILGSL